MAVYTGKTFISTFHLLEYSKSLKRNIKSRLNTKMKHKNVKSPRERKENSRRSFCHFDQLNQHKCLLLPLKKSLHTTTCLHFKEGPRRGFLTRDRASPRPQRPSSLVPLGLPSLSLSAEKGSRKGRNLLLEIMKYIKKTNKH